VSRFDGVRDPHRYLLGKVLVARCILSDPSGADSEIGATPSLGMYLWTHHGPPAAAAQSLQQALALGVPAGLAEDTYALLVESLSRSGDAGAAREAYSQYAEQFPESARAPELRKWLRDP